MDYETAHKYTAGNKSYIEKSKICGCCYCRVIFKSEEVVDYLPGNTAICPYCCIDSVVCDEIIPITDRLLNDMYERWFDSDDMLEYEAYDFKFEIGDLVKIKEVKKVGDINNLMLENDPDTSKASLETNTWYITEEEAKKSKDMMYEITNRYSFHMGLPIYQIQATNDVSVGRAAEFYLYKT